MPRLENWCVTPLAADPYTPPECQAHGLGGIVTGHPNFADGDSITTSEIKSIKSDADAVTVISGNGTEYVLGAVDPAYEKAYPNALRRLIATFNQRLPA